MWPLIWTSSAVNGYVNTEDSSSVANNWGSLAQQWANQSSNKFNMSNANLLQPPPPPPPPPPPTLLESIDYDNSEKLSSSNLPSDTQVSSTPLPAYENYASSNVHRNIHLNQPGPNWCSNYPIPSVYPPTQLNQFNHPNSFYANQNYWNEGVYQNQRYVHSDVYNYHNHQPVNNVNLTNCPETGEKYNEGNENYMRYTEPNGGISHSNTFPNNAVGGVDEYYNCHDQDYRQLPPGNTGDIDWRDTDIRPGLNGVPGYNSAEVMCPSEMSCTNEGSTGFLKSTPICPPNPRSSMTHLPVPDHLIPAFEEAAASTGAWPPVGGFATNTKRKALPAWLREELEKIEKKKAKEMAAVSNLCNVENAERDDEGDVVMGEDDQKADNRDGLSDDESSIDFGDSKTGRLISRKRMNAEYHGLANMTNDSTLIDFESGDVDNNDIIGLYKRKSALDFRNRVSFVESLSPLSEDEFRDQFKALGEEEQLNETTRFITRTLTDILLTVTTEFITKLVTDTLEQSKLPCNNKKNVIGFINPEEIDNVDGNNDSDDDDDDDPSEAASVIGLVAYNSGSENEADESSNHQDSQSKPIDSSSSKIVDVPVNSESKSNTRSETVNSCEKSNHDSRKHKYSHRGHRSRSPTPKKSDRHKRSDRKYGHSRSKRRSSRSHSKYKHSIRTRKSKKHSRRHCRSTSSSSSSSSSSDSKSHRRRKDHSHKHHRLRRSKSRSVKRSRSKVKK